MSCTRSILGGLIGGITIGGISAGFDAASGAIGAAIFKASGYEDYNTTEAAQMGAIGGAILGGTTGVLVGAAVGAMDAMPNSVKVGGGGLLSACAGAVLSGLVGYGVLNDSAATETLMNLGKTALSFLVGGAINTVGASVVIGLCCVPIYMAVANSDKTPADLEKGEAQKEEPAYQSARPR